MSINLKYVLRYVLEYVLKDMAEKLRDKNIRKITKIAKHSFSVTLPIEMVEKLGWKEHQKVVVEREGEHITIKDWKK